MNFGKIVGKKEKGKELTEKEKRKYTLKEMLKDDIPQSAKMNILMQILFDEEESKVYRKRYEENRKLDMTERRVTDLQFGKVDLKNSYMKEEQTR